MIEIHEYTKNMKLKDYDYLLETYSDFVDLKPVYLPKIKGEWKIVVVDPTIKDVNAILGEQNIPKFLNLSIYVAKAKLQDVLSNYPEYAQKPQTNYDAYKDFIATLKHPIVTKAMNYAYRAANGNLNELQEALTRIDNNYTGDVISVKDIMSEFTYTKRIYTTQVVNEFLMRTRYRYSHYDTWLNELGSQYAYNSMYKVVKSYVKDKHNYINGQDVKNKIIGKIDGIHISVLYSLFVNSTHYSQLESILKMYDSITNESYRRYIDASLQ